jgi:hypothetical protein
MENLLQALLGFFFSVTILLVLLNNCAFSVGCGGMNRREMFVGGGCCGGDDYEGFVGYAGDACGGDEEGGGGW